MTDQSREEFLASIEAEIANRCNTPPFGWRCTRGKGHEGPCAAVECPEDVAFVERGMQRWREGIARQEAGDQMDKWARGVIDAALTPKEAP